MSIFKRTPSTGLGVTTCRYCPRRAVPGTNACEDHQGEAGRMLVQPQRAGYRDPLYRKNRMIALRRSGGLCEGCGKPLPVRPDGRVIFQAHHIDGDPTNNDPSNLLVCGTCCHDGAKRPD